MDASDKVEKLLCVVGKGRVVTVDGVVDESTLIAKLWREDASDSWTIVHELTDATGRVVRRDSWVNFKGGGLPPAGTEQGGL